MEASPAHPIDLDVLPNEVTDGLNHLRSLGTYTEPMIQELAELLACLVYSVNCAHETDRKLEETYGELHSVKEQTLAAIRSEEESSTQRLTLEDALQQGRDKGDQYRLQEAAKREEVKSMMEKIEALKKQLSAGSGWTRDQEAERKVLQMGRENVHRNLDNVTSVLKATRAEVETVTGALALLRKDVEDTLEALATDGGSIQEMQREAEKQVRRKATLEQDLQDLQSSVKELRQQLLDVERQLKDEKVDVMDVENQLRDAKAQMEKYLKEYDALFRQTQKLTEELDVQVHVNDGVDKDNKERKETLVEKAADLKALAKEEASVVAARKIVTEKIAEVELERGGFESERDKLKLDVDRILGVDIKSAKKDGELLKKKIDEKKREKEILTRKIGGSEKATAMIYDLEKVNENSSRNLQNEMIGFMATVKEQRHTIEHLVKEREKHEVEIDVATQKHYTAIEELKLQEVQISDLQKKIIDGGSRLKQQQNLYEAVRSDRNLYSKNLIESQEEIAEMKRRFKIMNHHIEQLKEEITSKDHALVKEHFNHHNVDKERETLKNELTKIRKQILSSEQIIGNQKVEVQKLNQIIQEADEERARQVKEYDAVISEREILNNQLIKRNEELTVLYEKVKVQRSILHHGELQYQDRMAEIASLERSLETLKREKLESVKESGNHKYLRQQCLSLEKSLLQERTKIKALSEELDRPLNVHRWRHLESSDPSRFDMIRKIQNLQKRLISTTEEVMEKDSLILEKEKLYVELKNILGRQPGPEVAEQIELYKSNLKEKHKQIKAMDIELEMYKQQVDEFKRELNDMADQGRELKKQWLRKMGKQSSDDVY